MAYKELIKNFDRTRSYMREFYVNGYKSRTAFGKKSPRSYDDERRRIESWLGEYVAFYNDKDGKHISLSIDSRTPNENPLFRVWKTHSFTDSEITLHFILMDILSSGESYTVQELLDLIDDRYLSEFDHPRIYDISGLRKKLKEYVLHGLIESEKHGKEVRYRLKSDGFTLDALYTAISFFSETMPCGVIGGFLMDKQPKADAERIHSLFSFKHHYITQVLDSEVMYHILMAMREKREVVIYLHRKDNSQSILPGIVPLKLLISTQNGREYLAAYDTVQERYKTFRIDYIDMVLTGEVSPDYDLRRQDFSAKQQHIWGVSMGSAGDCLEHVEFTVEIGSEEAYIYNRLEREKRCGSIIKLDETHYRFSADVYDTVELFPWIRTFICRITHISFSSKQAEEQFICDLKALYELYGLEAI